MGVIQRQSTKNFFTSYIGIVIGFVNALIIQPRFLTPEELGLTRILYSFSLLLSTAVPMGLANIAIRYFPLFKNPGKRHNGFFGFMLYGTILGFLFTAGLVMLGRTQLIAQYVSGSELFVDYFHWVLPLTFFLAFVTQFNVYCYSLYKSTVPSFINDIVVKAGVIVLVTLYYYDLFDLDIYVLLFVMLYGFQNILLLAYIYYEDTPGFRFNLKLAGEVGWRNMIGYGLVLWVASVSATGMKELAPVVLGAQISLDNVAIYTVAAFIPTLIEVPLNALDKIATFNISSALAHKQMGTVKEIYRKSGRYMLLIGGMLFLLINGNIDSLFIFLPEQYRGGGEIVFILSFATFFNMCTGLNSQILFYTGRYYYASATMVGAVVLNLMLQIRLIPEYGIVGAAIATAISGMALNVINTVIVRVHYHMLPFDGKTIFGLLLVAIVYFADTLVPHMTNPYLDIALHGTIITLLFAGPVYYLKMIPEMNSAIAAWFRRS